MVAEVALQKMTVAEFREMELDDNDTSLYELINGEVFRRSAPTPRHQELLSELNDLIKAHVKTNQSGKVYFATIDVFLNNYTAVQPDLVFVPTDQLAMITTNGIEGVPALIVEIVSPSSIVRDRQVKYEVYEQAGVAEYWLVDPANQEIEVYQWQQQRYVLLSAASAIEGTLASAVLPGFVLDLKTLFA